MLSEARNELDDFVHSSKELEEELLRELERTEKTQKDLKDKVSRAETDRDEWKVNFPLLLGLWNCASCLMHVPPRTSLFNYKQPIILPQTL